MQKTRLFSILYTSMVEQDEFSVLWFFCKEKDRLSAASWLPITITSERTPAYRGKSKLRCHLDASQHSQLSEFLNTHIGHLSSLCNRQLAETYHFTK